MEEQPLKSHKIDRMLRRKHNHRPAFTDPSVGRFLPPTLNVPQSNMVLILSPVVTTLWHGVLKEQEHER